MAENKPRRLAARLGNLFGAAKTAVGKGGAESGAQARRSGPPGATDKDAIAARLQVVAGAAKPMGKQEAAGLAGRIVSAANEALAALNSGATPGELNLLQSVGLEAVLYTRGRPAIRVLGDDLESPLLYPDAQIWAVIVDTHRDTMLAACSSVAAVRVRDVYLPEHPWVQGTAWLVAPDLAITNRHVLFPPMGGATLARREAGSNRAQLKTDYGLTLDFAFDNGAKRSIVYAVTGVPFVSAKDDPMDAALLRVTPLGSKTALPLKVSGASVSELDRMYVIGHPGKLPHVPEDVFAVFGTPDERKRVSFGHNMDEEADDPAELIYDASTVGGFSGGCVLGFMANEARALHYFGDSKAGNRAISSAVLRRHSVLGTMLPL